MGRIGFAVITLIIICCKPVWASDIETQRAQFAQAEAAIKAGNMQTYYQLKPQLTDYPLYPYLQYAEISRMMRRSTPSDHVQAFIEAYPDSSLAHRLQIRWLLHLAKHHDWENYHKFYEPIDSTQLQCHAIFAEYKVTDDARILKKAEPLWLHGHSQPKACDALFAAYTKSDHFGQAQAWQRAQLAMEARQSRLARYLKRHVNKDQQGLIDTWYKLHRNPSSVTQRALFKGDDPYEQTLQLYAIKRLASKNNDTALAKWAAIESEYPFTQAQRGEIARVLGLDLATDHDPRARTWLAQVPADQADEAVHAWRVRSALREGDWQGALDALNQMPDDLQAEGPWQYWRGRSLAALGDERAANAAFKRAADERSYHGMLASNILDQDYSLHDTDHEPHPQDLRDVTADPGIQRALELLALQRIVDARREWRTSTEYFNESQLQTAAQIAHELDWHHQAILTAAKAENRDDLDLRFPTAYKDAVKKSAKDYNLDPAWVFAITRQESAFLPDAKSSANAMGLMQLLPSTAREVARKNNIRYTGQSHLLDPDKNICLGSAFLAQLLERYDGNMAFASAAYNAGPGRVTRWQPETDMPLDVWVETIPFHETRNYVQNVFAYLIIYQHHLGETQTLNQHAYLIERP